MTISTTKFYMKYLYISVLLVYLGACQPPKEQKQEASLQKEKPLSGIRHAEGFDIIYKEDFKVLRVFKAFTDRQDTLQYLLLPKGKPRPEGYADVPIIEVPLRHIAVLSTTHAGFSDKLRAMAGTEYLYSPALREGVAKGRITALQEQGLNEELLLALQPGALMASGMAHKDFAQYRRLEAMGIPVLVNAEWLESSPLGKAEWLKFVAAFFDKDALADSLFAGIEARYMLVKEKTQALLPKEKKSAFTGAAYKGTWYVPGGRSFAACFLRDAGAQYPWQSSENSGSLPLSFEEVYARVLEADCWIQPDAGASLQAIAAADKRYQDLRAFRQGEVYLRNKRQHSQGGNDYWEAGVVQPDIVLADLVKILYPDLLPAHELYFYQKCPAE
jgi:iron complex transport system substrate-binding protein